MYVYIYIYIYICVRAESLIIGWSNNHVDNPTFHNYSH